MERNREVLTEEIRDLVSMSIGNDISLDNINENSKMPWTYERKISNKSWSEAEMTEAVTEVKSGRMGVRRAANIFGVPYTTLQRRVSAPEGTVFGRLERKPVLPRDIEDALASR
ncbi:hypothetical protein ANN_24522 [Periplaneta americana]|uniref:HTH psq-type domain-containing protein n=1 Tax=Periplaneta americana TaxID=6978 RepID=A0ABQ8S3J4_PERAM|nr:hypothetical protein ANN_24522 [Periplaneta americana]